MRINNQKILLKEIAIFPLVCRIKIFNPILRKTIKALQLQLEWQEEKARIKKIQDTRTDTCAQFIFELINHILQFTMICIYLINS